MKKYLVLAIVIALLLIVTPEAYAAFGYQKDGADSGHASKVDFRNAFTTFDGSKVTFYGNGYADGVTTNTTDKVTNLTSKDLAYGVIIIEDSGATDDRTSSDNYISLANGTAGQMVTIIYSAPTDPQNSVLYITDDQVNDGDGTMTNTGWDDIAFDLANDQVTLLYVDDTYGWVIVGQVGVTVT